MPAVTFTICPTGGSRTPFCPHFKKLICSEKKLQSNLHRITLSHHCPLFPLYFSWCISCCIFIYPTVLVSRILRKRWSCNEVFPFASPLTCRDLPQKITMAVTSVPARIQNPSLQPFIICVHLGISTGQVLCSCVFFVLCVSVCVCL